MILLAMFFMLLMGLPAQADDDLSVFAYDQRIGNQLPLAVPFADEQGRVVTLGQSLSERPTILALGYFRCPNLCGLVRNDLMNAVADHDYNLIVLSIDPSETPADAQSARAADVTRSDTATSWHYLTGSAADIQAVATAVGFRSRYDDRARQFLHPAGIVFLTATGTVSSYLLGLGYQPGDVGLGVTRAANGVTARALPILLLCFHYDSATGRYTLAIMRLLQLGAAITVLVIGGTVMLAFRRERRPR